MSHSAMEAHRPVRFHCIMRAHRPHLPGAAFHIMARTQGREPWFVDLLERIREIIVEGVTTSDANLISYAVMPNHFHIVLQQGTRPLGWVMQPVMRRTALLVQRKFDRIGHVFERRFLAKHCDSPDYLRTAIGYTHLNGWYAGLCDTPEAYPWSSHARYVQTSEPGVVDLEVVRVLRLFAQRGDESPDELRRCYQKHIEWTCEKHRCEESGIPFERLPPRCEAGERYFYETFSALQLLARKPLKDLRDKAIELLAEVAPHLSIDVMRVRYLKRDVRNARKQVIAGLLQRGYTNKAIADYFRMSYSAVSAIATAMRYAGLQRS